MAGLRLLQKQLQLWLLWWRGFSNRVGAVLKNVWQNGFTRWIETVKCLNCPFLYFFFFPFSPLIFFFSPFFPSSLSIRLPPPTLASLSPQPHLPRLALVAGGPRPPPRAPTAGAPLHGLELPSGGLPTSLSRRRLSLDLDLRRPAPPAPPRFPASGRRPAGPSSASSPRHGRLLAPSKGQNKVTERRLHAEPDGATFSWLRLVRGSR